MDLQKPVLLSILVSTSRIDCRYSAHHRRPVFIILRVPTAQLKKKSVKEYGNFAKTQGIWFAQVVNSLILKVKDILMIAAKMSNYFCELDKSAKSVLYMQQPQIT